jgi:hypothetical protein
VEPPAVEPTDVEAPAGEAPVEPPAVEPTDVDAPAGEAPAEPPAAEPPVSDASTPAPAKPSPAPPRPKPRRKRPSAAERHRKIFFARLGDLRRAEAAGKTDDGAEAPAVEPAPEAEAVVQESATQAPEPATEEATPPEPIADEATSPEPIAEESTAPDPTADEAAPKQAPAAAPAEPAAPPAETGPVAKPAGPPRAKPPRLVVAIERVGGPEVVRAALAPKHDDHGKPMKWAAVCCAQAQGLKPGDPAFNGWVRLAATPVRAIKAEVVEERPQQGRRGGPGRDGGGGGRRADGPGRSDRGGGQGSRDRGPRRPREDRVKPEDLAAHGQGGTVGPSVRILAAGDTDKHEREARRKAEREAKRKAERERLSRFGY